MNEELYRLVQIKDFEPFLMEHGYKLYDGWNKTNKTYSRVGEDGNWVWSGNWNSIRVDYRDKCYTLMSIKTSFGHENEDETLMTILRWKTVKAKGTVTIDF